MLFWIYPVIVILMTFYFAYEMVTMWQVYITLRQKYFTTHEYLSSPHVRTLLLSEIVVPTEESIKKFLAPAIPKTIYLGRDFGGLYSLYQEHRKLTLQLESVLVKYLKDPKNIPAKRPTHYKYFLFTPVDSISYYGEKLNDVTRKIYSIRTQPLEYFKTNSGAFVSFPTITKAYAALKATQPPFSFLNVLPQARTQHCPDYDDVIWENVGTSPQIQRSKSILSTAITIGLIIGWTFITSFVSGLEKISTWRNIPGIGSYIAGSPILTIFIQSFLTPILIIVLNLLLPIVLVYLSKLNGKVSLTGAERSALVRFFYFLVFQFIGTEHYFLIPVYIGTGFVESYISYILLKTRQTFEGKVIDDKGTFTREDGSVVVIGNANTIVEDFGRGFVKASNHFMIIAITSWSAYSLEMIQLAPFILRYFKKQLSSTPRQRNDVDKPPGKFFL
jgi:hypothetical protein